MEKLLERLRAAEARAKELAGLDELSEEQQKEFDEQRAEIDKVKGLIEEKRARLAEVNGFTEAREQVESKLEQPVRKPVRERSANPVIEQVDRKFDTLGEFLLSVRSARKTGKTPDLLREVQDRQKELRAATGMQVAVPSDGGFFLQSEHEAGIMKHVWGGGEILSRCSQRDLEYGIDSVTANGIDESSRANGSRAGGVRGYWLNEADAITASKPKFHQLKYEPQGLHVAYYMTGKLARSASFLKGEVEEAVAQELLFKIEDAIIRGSGAGQPLGLKEASALISVAIESGQTVSDPILAENISKMWARMPAQHRRNAVWLINQELEPYMDKLNLAAGATGGQLVYMPEGGMADAPYARLKGRPVVPTEFQDAPGTVSDIMLVDLSQYKVVKRPGTRAASSIHVRFLNDEEVFRFDTEVDGQLTWKDAVTPYKGSNTLSPVVALAARS